MAEKPRVWTDLSVAWLNASVGAQYDVAPDGKRMAAVTHSGASGQAEASHVIFLENFFDELQRKVPLNGR